MTRPLISVIIPTLNEASHLGETLEVLKHHAENPSRLEVIVSDTGSSDRTHAIAKKYGVKLIIRKFGAKGRAYPLNEGAKAARGFILFFLDADSRPPFGFDTFILKALKPYTVVGGAFEFALKGKGFGLRLVELVNRVRYRIWKEYYGDQGLFVRREIFEAVGGFPERALLESAYLCKALQREGKLFLIKQKMLTSARRFLDVGVYKMLARDIKIWGKDLIGFSTERLGKSYWNWNKEYGLQKVKSR